MPSSLRPIQSDPGGFLRRPPPATLALMVLTAVVSIVGMFDGGRFGSGGVVVRQLYFTPSQVLDSWRVWTPFIYLLYAPDPLTFLIYEALGLWMFAAPLERAWGERRFLYYFFGTGTGAAILTTLLGMWISPLRAVPASAAWVATDALIVAWVLMNWHGTALLYIIPVPAPLLLVLPLGMAALNILMGIWEPFVTPLLGMGIGYLMLKQSLSPRRALLHVRAWWIDRQLRRKARHLRVMPPPERDRDEPKGPKYLN